MISIIFTGCIEQTFSEGIAIKLADKVTSRFQDN